MAPGSSVVKVRNGKKAGMVMVPGTVPLAGPPGCRTRGCADEQSFVIIILTVIPGNQLVDVVFLS